jgi:hypothetical protein
MRGLKKWTAASVGRLLFAIGAIDQRPASQIREDWEIPES